MKNGLDKMESKYGTCNYEGTCYTLTQQAYMDGSIDRPVFRALAICDGDEADAEGWQPAYEIEWDLLDDFDLEEDDDLSWACDWEHADRVRRFGEYNVDLKRHA